MKVFLSVVALVCGPCRVPRRNGCVQLSLDEIPWVNLREQSSLATDGRDRISEFANDTVHAVVAFNSSAVNLEVLLQALGVLSHSVGPGNRQEGD